ncbi:MAG: hypothetical protein HOE92_04725 [Euryarchaeota archaeon]|jgi:D-glycero-alpha-D-manno-heptose-7-phosphate kinase|nr:hypothetical protein [Euryarchaeota archaeon]MBT3971504.1 hypothetical protein [Euryarchaeota archaeon]
MAKEIKVRAPVRVDLAGGWTDCAPFTNDKGGEVVNFAINQYIEANMKIDDEGRLSVAYSSDCPVSSGLGTSAAMNVAFLSAIAGEGRSDVEIAELAYRFEELLGNRGGRQDQWAAAGGGFQHLMFYGDNVERLPFEPAPSALRWLKKHLILAYTNVTHNSGELHNSIWQRYDEEDEEVHSALMTLREMARQVAGALNSDRRNDLIDAIRQVSAAIEKMSPELNAPYREVVDPLTEAKSILAWKGMGAAAGGTIGIISNHDKQKEIIAACESAGWTILDWDYDSEGLIRSENNS